MQFMLADCETEMRAAELLVLQAAVLATRALLGVLARFRWFDNPRFMGASAEKIPDWQKVDIVGMRRIWFCSMISQQSSRLVSRVTVTITPSTCRGNRTRS